MVIGFNVINFDYEVLKGYSLNTDFSQIKTFDILDYIFRNYGFRTSLDNIAQPTLHQVGWGDGIQAVQWFREGDFDRLIRYCQKDVEVTRDIFYFGERNWHIKYWNDHFGGPERLDVEWAGICPNRGGNNINKIIMLKTNWANNYWSQEQLGAPYRTQYINLPLENLRRLLPLPAIGIYIDGDSGDFSREPFQFMKIMGINEEGENIKFHTIPLPTETIASVQVPRRTNNLFEVIEHPQQIIAWLNEQTITSPPEWLELVNRQPQPTNQETWQDWIGEHFKKLNSNNISNDEFEDIVADIFRAIGFEVEQMGHKRPGAFPDGILKTSSQLGFAFVYDCKNSSNYHLPAADSRAMSDYLENEQRRLREGEPNLKVYPLFIAKSFSNNFGEAGFTADNLLYLLYKRLKLGKNFSLLPFEEAWRRKKIAKDFIDKNWTSSIT